jgi:dTDP-4-amino-4,6-dideoxygalactose transaminase
MTTKPTSHTIALPSDQDATGRTLGEEEIRALGRAIATGTLTSTKGRFVREFEEKFAKILGVKYAYACASGTAAVHCAVAALNPEPGDEIITTAITDMGALTPILYQGAIPVFADVDPVTLNVTAETVRRAISDRTRAIMVTHLFGNPCEMAKIKKLADERSIPIIEDCAQAFMTQVDGKYVGTIGAVGAFSLQQGKHITTGEGGIVATNDPDLARRVYLFINKAWGYGDPKPDHYFLALNYRLSELQGAVAVAQLEKLNFSVSQRRKMADRLTAAIKGLPGIQAPVAAKGAVHTYWKYPLHLDNSIIKGGPVALASALKEANIASAPRYIQKPAFECAVLRDQVTFGRSRWPFTLARKEAVDYGRAKFPGTYGGLESVLVLPWNERYTEEHVDHIAAALKRRVLALAKEGANV